MNKEQMGLLEIIDELEIQDKLYNYCGIQNCHSSMLLVVKAL